MSLKNDLEKEPGFTMKQTQQVRALIQKECCNFDSGNCSRLDDGEVHKCPQLQEKTLKCSWFKEVVLPLNKALEVGILRKDIEIEDAKCTACGKPIVKKSNRSKYCLKCVLKIRRQRNSESMRKSRVRVYN